ncbi:hypothetical protein BDR06DRAFT_973467 [Suillus hirtellus]|nr:hypothetical protein BDR06DRAFT_973467 [Suillus hirtellus]
MLLSFSVPSVSAPNFASVIASGLMLWKGLGLILNTEYPIVVVLSGSMEPAFYRGDLLFLTNPPGQRYHTGSLAPKIPIVHRVLETRDVFISFDNSMENRIINNRFLPYIGYVTIAMNDFPQLKYALLGGLGLSAVIQQE